MSGWDNISWKPFGGGRQAPAGSIPSRKLAQKIADYKNRVAGRYRSVSPQDISGVSGAQILSPKIDGETWFLYCKNGEALLLSPSGKILTDIPVTNEAVRILGNRQLLLAGELYAIGNTDDQATRPRLQDLQSALGGGKNAKADTLRFAAFDLLEETRINYQRRPFAKRADKLHKLLKGADSCHCAAFEKVSCSVDIIKAYQRLVTDQGHEGIVVRSADGGIRKIKPEITIDAVIVGFTEKTSGGITELLLALIRPDDKSQIIGRVNTGFRNADRLDLSQRLRLLISQSTYLASSRSGALFRFVKPQIVVEIKCNDLLAIRSNGEPVRRMVLERNEETWQAIRPMPAVSLINAVFRQIREDKAVSSTTVRFSQVTDLVPVQATDSAQNVRYLQSTVIRREVLTKTSGSKTSVRKAVIWKTNKEEVDLLYPPYAVFFTDFSPGRENPLKTDIRISSCLEKINWIANAWLDEHQTKGWEKGGEAKKQSPIIAFPDTCKRGNGFQLDLAIALARSSSINFPTAVSRIKSLAKSGKLSIENDNKGQPRRYALAFEQAKLMENIRKIENLIKIVGKWKGAEFMVNGDPVDLYEFQDVLSPVIRFGNCWRQQKRQSEPCRNSCFLGCKWLWFKPSPGYPSNSTLEAWYAVGKFENNAVVIDKEDLIKQLDSQQNEPLQLCQFFESEKIKQRIRDLPETLDPEKDSNRWLMGYKIESGEPAWVFPHDYTYLPFGITLQPDHDLYSQELSNDSLSQTPSDQHVGLGLKVKFAEADAQVYSQRNIPQTRYADICGQDRAAELVKDYAELPLKHAALFEQVGIKPGKGILLHGPPGNGKTLLARAVAGESGSHIETISGPEILSKWVGESEQNLREIFERAAQFAPSVIIMDEVDALAGNRESDNLGYLRQIVSQLLVLMDGLSDRGRVLIIGTTNCPDYIDPAILRPGRIDKKIFMGLPDKQGRMALFEKLLARMPIAEHTRIDELADITDGFSGAEVEHSVNEAGLLAIKEAIAKETGTEAVRVTQEHFFQAIDQVIKQKRSSSRNKASQQPTSILAPYQAFSPYAF